MSSPTVSLKAVMISCTIDVKEGRYIIVTDIPEARLHADMDDTVHMLLEGMTAELIVKLERKMYTKYIWRRKEGKPMLYIQLREELLQAAILFCN